MQTEPSKKTINNMSHENEVLDVIFTCATQSNSSPILKFISDTVFHRTGSSDSPPDCHSERSGKVGSQTLPVTDAINAIPKTLDFDANARAIVFYQSALVALANALSRNESIDDVMDEWLSLNTKILAMQSRYRGKIILVDINECLQDHERFLSVLKEAFNCSPQHGKNDFENEISTISPLVYVVSQYLLSKMPEVLNCAGELEASSFLRAKPVDISHRQVVADYRDKLSSAESYQFKEKEHISSLEQQLHQLQEKYEIYYFRSQKLSALIDSDTRELRANQMQINLYREIDLEDTRSDVEILHQIIQDIYASKSWQLTAPLRSTLDLLAKFKSKH